MNYGIELSNSRYELIRDTETMSETEWRKKYGERTVKYEFKVGFAGDYVVYLQCKFHQDNLNYPACGKTTVLLFSKNTGKQEYSFPLTSHDVAESVLKPTHINGLNISFFKAK